MFGERHLGFLVWEYERHYDTVRSHQGIENRTIGMTALAPPGSSPPDPSEVECDFRLGWFLRHYCSKAA